MAGGGGIRKSKTIYYMRYQLHLPSSRTPDNGIKMPIKNLFKSEIFVVSFAMDSRAARAELRKIYSEILVFDGAATELRHVRVRQLLQE